MERNKKLCEEFINVIRAFRDRLGDMYAVEVDNYNELCADHEEGSFELVRAWARASSLDTADEKLVDCILALKNYLEIC